jgi:hypothetical protein
MSKLLKTLNLSPFPVLGLSWLSGSATEQLSLRIRIQSNELKISKCVKALAENCPQLEHLSLVGCYLLNDPCIVKLATSCPKLRCRNCLSLQVFQSLGAGIVYPSWFFKA